MKLSRAQALELLKATHHVCDDEYGNSRDELKDVVKALETFLVSEPTDQSSDDDYEESDEEGCSACAAVDDEEVDDEEDEITSDGSVSALVLHRLTLQRAVPVSTSLADDLVDCEDGVELSFESTTDDEGTVECLDLLIGEGEHIVSDVDFVKRTGTEIHVHERGIGWHVFSTGKFNKDWTKSVPVNKVLDVVE